MSDNPLVAAPVIPPAPIGETLPVPTPEQELTADQLFSRSDEHHVAADLLGMVAATHLLHDLAVDTFCRSHRQEEDDQEGREPAETSGDGEE